MQEVGARAGGKMPLLYFPKELKIWLKRLVLHCKAHSVLCGEVAGGAEDGAVGGRPRACALLIHSAPFGVFRFSSTSSASPESCTR